MPVNLVQTSSMTAEKVKIKFSYSINIDSFLNENFVLASNDATPSIVVDPFEEITIPRDYDSISRVLTLWLKNQLVSNALYTLTISGLSTPYGEAAPTTVVSLTAPTDITVDEADQMPVAVPVVIEDVSIRDVASVALTYPIVGATENELLIESINPSVTDAAYLAEGYNEGRIEITFNTILAANFVSSDYFKLQRKTVGRGMARWEDVSAIVTSDSTSGVVIIYMPSNDTVPVYGEPDKIYWEKGYKYRLRISGSIGSATDTVYVAEPSTDIDGGMP